MAVFNWRGGCLALCMMHIGMDGGEWVEDEFVGDGTVKSEWEGREIGLGNLDGYGWWGGWCTDY